MGEGDFVVAPGQLVARNGAFQIPPFVVSRTLSLLIIDARR
jgi:hypothetical protein